MWLSFSERGLDLWKQDWALADPPPFTMFELRDAVAHAIGAQEIVPLEGTSEGELSEVTPTGSGARTRVPGATLQAIDGDPYVRVTQDKIVLKIGGTMLTLVDGGMRLTTPSGTQTLGAV